MRAVEIETEYSGRREERRDPDGDFYGTVRFLLGLTAVFLAFVAIFTNVLIGVRVSGDSMNPTLHGGDYLFIYAWGEPDYGDIVVFEHGNEEYINHIFYTDCKKHKFYRLNQLIKLIYPNIFSTIRTTSRHARTSCTRNIEAPLSNAIVCNTDVPLRDSSGVISKSL